jgi:hypothetical protein
MEVSTSLQGAMKTTTIKIPNEYIIIYHGNEKLETRNMPGVVV